MATPLSAAISESPALPTKVTREPRHDAATEVGNRTRAYVVAVTGGIASGKSAVTSRLESLGVPVFDADVVTRELCAPGQPALSEIAAHFGPAILLADGTLDRRALRERVFANAGERRELESILHPRVRTQLAKLADAVTGPYCVLAIPLLAEGNRYRWIDRVVVVDAPDEKRLERLMRRDGINATLAGQMIAAQADRASRLAIADEVIDNSGSLSALLEQTDALHARIMLLALKPAAPDGSRAPSDHAL
jgi:dephospho-CoA kinase